jgi:phosphoglycerol transferase
MPRPRPPWVPLIVALALAAGCGDSPETTTTSSQASPTLAPAQSYQATLEEGVDFRLDGFPVFIAEAQGLSAREPFGRWSDANLAPAVRLVFRDPLPRKFEVAVTAFAFAGNEKRPVVVRVGGVERSFSLDTPHREHTQVLTFELPGDASTLEIVPPKPLAPRALDPKSGDDRRLGIALVTLRIRKL